jgi:hypothetical protein
MGPHLRRASNIDGQDVKAHRWSVSLEDDVAIFDPTRLCMDHPDVAKAREPHKIKVRFFLCVPAHIGRRNISALLANFACVG